MSYIISDGKRYIARAYRTYTARDYIMPLNHEFGGRVTASDALTYDTEEGAQAYIERNRKFLSECMPEARVLKYDVCCNCVLER